MSFRLEEKIPATIFEIEKLYRQLQDEGMLPLHPTRIIHSVYFDTPDNQIFFDSEEGCLPRRKVRIRHYPEDKKASYLLELKTSSIEGRYKTSDPLTKTQMQKLLKQGFFDNHYGVLMPKTEVTYRREYCQFNNVRITFDRNIQYCPFQAKHRTHHERQQVVEIKNPYRENLTALEKIFAISRHRFSKFSNSMHWL